MSLQKTNIKPHNTSSSAVANQTHAVEKKDSSVDEKTQSSAESIISQKTISTASGSSGLPPLGAADMPSKNHSQIFKPVIQTKLSVSNPTDEYEKEADDVANQVMTMPEKNIPKFAPITTNNPVPIIRRKEEEEESNIQSFSIFRKSEDNEPTVTPWIETRLNESKGSGNPLPDDTKANMENRFGADFSSVKVHKGSNAVQMNQELNAQAFTHGNDIYFNSGKYDTESNSGKHLLAHELTHVVQQSNTPQSLLQGNILSKPDANKIQRDKELPKQPTDKDTRAYYEDDYASFNIREDVQWNVGWEANGVLLANIVLIVYLTPPKKGLSSFIIAQIAVGLFGEYGLRFKPGQSGGLQNAIMNTLISMRSEEKKDTNTVYYISLTREYTDKLFEEGDLTAFIDRHKKETGNQFILAGYLLASTNLPDDKPTKVSPPAWLLKKRKDILNLVKKAKDQEPRLENQPDSILMWYNENNKKWYFLVYVHISNDAKEKAYHGIQVKEDESIDDLYVRTQDAAAKSLEKYDKSKQRRIESSLPKWAQVLKKKIEDEIEKIRKSEPGATNIPDGIELCEEKAPETEPETTKEAKPQKIFFNIWVERGEKQKERKKGTVPVPLTQDTTVETLMPFIRNLSAILREFENMPSMKASDTVPNPDKLALPAFPALIKPVDLAPDNISVTGAKNSFHMELNFEAVYGTSGSMTDLFIASKLYQQPITYVWKIFEVPQNQGTSDDTSKSWPERWQKLYEQYNPGLIEGEEEQKDESVPLKPPKIDTNPVFTKSNHDFTSQLEFRDKEGDYLVYCAVVQSSIGDNKLKRNPSIAYYPVRLKPIKQVASQAVSQRTGAIERTQKEIEEFKTLLDSKDVTDNQKDIIKAVIEEKTANLTRLSNKEKGSIVQNIEDELSFISETITKLDKLEKILPGILTKCEKEGEHPSKLLKDADPSLLNLYSYIIWQKTTISGYKKDLQEKSKQLQQIKGRAREFSSEIKTSSSYQFAPEAAFASKVTGQVYPLVLMIAEAKDSTEDEIKYCVIDITSKQTQKVYTGSSTSKGAAGHNEAIKKAFEDFGKDATYGEGIFAVRIPEGKAGKENPNHPGTEIKYYESKEGIKQKVLFALGIIGAIAGAAALAATGVGAPVAAAWLGLFAGILGAITAIHNINERTKRHTFAWDYEMALDIISIISIIPAGAGVKLANLSKTVRGFNEIRMLGRYLQIYGWTEMGATVMLVPAKLYEDFQKIDRDVENKELTPDQAKALKAQLVLYAMQTGIMMLGGAVAAHVGGKKVQQRMSEAERTSLEQQAKFLDMEGFSQKYQSLKERNLINENGTWTDSGKEFIKTVVTKTEVEPIPKQSEPAPTAKQTEPVSKQPPVVAEDAPPKKSAPPKDVASEPVPKKVPSEPTLDTPPKDKAEVPEEAKKQTPSAEQQDSPPKATSSKIEPEPTIAAAEPSLNKKIETAEAEVDKSKAVLDHFETKVKEAKANKAKAKGKNAKAEAQTLVDEAEALSLLAHHDYEIAKDNASKLRQQKLTESVAEARLSEEPALKKVTDRQEKLNDLARKKRDNLNKRDKLRGEIRDESGRPQEEIVAKLKEIEELNIKYDKLTEREKVEGSYLDKEYEALSERRQETLKRVEALQAEQRSAIGITPAEYESLRSKSPSGKIKRDIQKIKTDAIYDKPIDGTPEADHIVSMHEITQMPGFSKLTKKQKLQILNLEENFMALDKRVNSSKGDRSFSQWEGYAPFGEITPDKKTFLLQKEAELRIKIQQEIDKFVPKTP